MVPVMAILALASYLLYIALAFGLRTAIQLRLTGSSGFEGVGGRPGSAEWAASVLFVFVAALGFAVPLLALANVVEPIDTLDTDAVHVAGILLFAGGLVGTLAAQIAMGESWRIGVDETAATDLVTTGPFALVRNPIFTAMLPASAGLALMVPSVLAMAGLAALLVALELQVRMVEEPYLLRVHGERYARYARRVGRFLPGVGRLRAG